MSDTQNVPRTWREITAELVKDVFSPKMLWALIGATGLALCFMIYDAAVRNGCVNFGFFESSGCKTNTTQDRISVEQLKNALLADASAINLLKGENGASIDIAALVSKLSNNEQLISSLTQSSKLTEVELSRAIDFWFKNNPSIVGHIPSGAVIAFDRPTACPKEWTALGPNWTGRTFVVASTLQNAASKYSYRQTGGTETHTLSPDEMPVHAHNANYGDGAYLATGPNQYLLNKGGKLTRTHDSTGGKPHNNMPPYIALYFCKKD